MKPWREQKKEGQMSETREQKLRALYRRWLKKATTAEDLLARAAEVGAKEEREAGKG